MSKAKKKAGRPFLLADNDTVSLASREAKSKLQESSDRRAIVNRVIDFGGKATVEQLNAAFGYDVRAILLALVKVGWLEIQSKSLA
jgi:hypothetical protein